MATTLPPKELNPIHGQRSPIGREVIPYGYFQQGVLAEAVRLIEGKSDDYRFDSQGRLHIPVPQCPLPDFLKSYDGLFGVSDNFSIDRLQTVQAALAILINVAQRRDRNFQPDQAIRITALPEKKGTRGALIQGMFDDLELDACDYGDSTARDSYYSDVPDDLVEYYNQAFQTTVVEQVQELEQDLAALANGESITAGHWRDEYDGHSLFRLLKEEMHAMRSQKADDEIWRLHNQFPNAVNFYFASRDAEFLLEKDGAGQTIQHIVPFLNSYWPQLAGRLDVTVDPVLIEQAKHYLRYRPLRDSTPANAVG